MMAPMFEVGGIAYFHLTNASRARAPIEPELHYTIHDFDNWFDRDQTYSTMISTDFTNHGYEGKPLK